jgi:hypothetical protein
MAEGHLHQTDYVGMAKGKCEMVSLCLVNEWADPVILELGCEEDQGILVSLVGVADVVGGGDLLKDPRVEGHQRPTRLAIHVSH